jgi:hypothetical protein
MNSEIIWPSNKGIICRFDTFFCEGRARVTGDVKSELLFDILKRLRNAGVKLSNPETVRVEHLR